MFVLPRPLVMRSHTFHANNIQNYEVNNVCWSLIRSSLRDLLDYLQNKHLLARNMQCQRCTIPMSMKLQTRDGSVVVMFLAGDVQHFTYKSIQQESFFSKSWLSLQKWLLLMHLWSRDCPVTDCCWWGRDHREECIDLRVLQRCVLLAFGCSWSSHSFRWCW